MVICLDPESEANLARLVELTGQPAERLLSEALREKRDAAEIDALREDIARRVSTNRRLPADEVFGRLEARHARRISNA